MNTRAFRRYVGASAALFFAAVACNKGADTSAQKALATTGIALPDGKTPSILVAALDSSAIAKLEVRRGEAKDADASSTWNAYLSDGSVRVIDERTVMGDSSTRRTMHYYTSDGHLAANIETRDQLAMSGKSSPVRQFVFISMEFVGDSVTKSSKSVNGEPKPIEPFEVANAKKHADALLAAALTAPVASPAKP
jgi:hypothetical protein